MVARIEMPPERVVDVEGPVHYREWEGPDTRTFVLVHGLGGAHVNWAGVAPGLADLGRVVVPDLAGFGDTPLAGRSASLRANRQLLSGFLRKVADGPVVLCGNSMGGAHVMLQAAVEPDSVSALVLTGSVFPRAKGGMPSPIVVGGFAMYRVPGVGGWLARQRFRKVAAERMVRFGFRMCAADGRSIPQEVVRAHVDMLRSRQEDPEAVPAFLEATRSLLRLGRRPDIGRRIMDAVACPVLVLHGRRDRLVPAAFAEAAVLDHPAWTLREFPELGHIPHLEAPERWLSAVRAWIGALR